jgi:S-adenosylmethionine hydrolase
LKVDRFGNIVTNLRHDDFPNLEKRPFVLRIGNQEIKTLADHYEHNGLFALWGSSEYLEVSARQESAAARTGCAAGDAVGLRIEGKN